MAETLRKRRRWAPMPGQRHQAKREETTQEAEEARGGGSEGAEVLAAQRTQLIASSDPVTGRTEAKYAGEVGMDGRTSGQYLSKRDEGEWK
ncbi:hypothetical protein R1flu_009515 [Riccia fluitans]|uniref:Uncharacterized protein n=1 Tax=Riccia fluitans TaxID=41844 RepID=A0ABD1Z346_9MARC